MENLAITVLCARDTGARLSEWERKFCETLEERLTWDTFFLSSAQSRSLIRLAETLGIDYDYINED